ncbi:ATP synthase subunit e, mitochondrial-like [Pomacea canaliculata]|uniref:ATP synthase subunit e, mitochondrial-like n=1 Tax=Pomacea canaliculata TaxID=400727 RepID=UPI000D72B16C|nr:ATP synthase subunit e, mitochondrial-like [Pomacea canaliculata]
MATLAPPKAVSPLIRFGRYTALLAGFMYGASNLKRLTRKEEKIQEHENKLRAIRNAKHQAEKEKLAKLEMDALGREVGVLPK